MRYLIFVLFGLSLPIFAGEPTAYAGQNWFYNITAEGLAIDGYDPVAYFTQGEPTQGKPEFSHVHQGITYRFANADHHKRFKQNPQAWLPRYGGWCAFAIGVDSVKFKFGAVRFAPDPKSFKIVDNQLYLFANLPNFNALDLWNTEDETAMIKRAEAFWQSRLELAKKVPVLPQGMNRMAPIETAQFDFIIGEWENTVQQLRGPEFKEYFPGVPGTWKASYHWDGFGIADNWQQVGVPGSGGPAFRSFDPLTRKWVMTYIPSNRPRDQTWLMEGAFNEKGELA